jgi:polysaccharide export outer membrane protein
MTAVVHDQRARRGVSLAAALLLAIGAGVGPLAPAPLQAQFPGDEGEATVLSPGDSLRVVVWRKPELSGDFVVAADGSVSHPLYRAVKVAGVPLGTAESRLRTFLEQYEASPQFVLQPLLRVAVGGEVRQPNLYSVAPGTSVEQALALAGGPTERGGKSVHVIRQGQAIVFDLRRPGASGGRTVVRSGDQILVDRDRAVFREIVAPVLTVIGATAAVVNVFVNSGRN